MCRVPPAARVGQCPGTYVDKAAQTSRLPAGTPQRGHAEVRVLLQAVLPRSAGEAALPRMQCQADKPAGVPVQTGRQLPPSHMPTAKRQAIALCQLDVPPHGAPAAEAGPTPLGLSAQSITGQRSAWEAAFAADVPGLPHPARLQGRVTWQVHRHRHFPNAAERHHCSHCQGGDPTSTKPGSELQTRWRQSSSVAFWRGMPASPVPGPRTAVRGRAARLGGLGCWLHREQPCRLCMWWEAPPRGAAGMHMLRRHHGAALWWRECHAVHVLGRTNRQLAGIWHST